MDLKFHFNKLYKNITKVHEKTSFWIKLVTFGKAVFFIQKFVFHISNLTKVHEKD